MLSSFVSSLSSIRSPKALLASYLASSLGAFLEVDPGTIELNLLSDTKIVLHHVQLKPQQTHKRTLQGEVDEIEFSWIWGGNGKTSFVREAKLTIRGARFRLVILPEDETVPSSVPSKTQGDGYMHRQVQQIIDHLALHVTDFQLAIETGVENAIFEAKSLELVSLGYSSDGKTEASQLSQKIFVESFCAFLTPVPSQKVDSWSRLPLLDPFMLTSSIRRVSGRRFDGLALGLDVVGEISSSKRESSENVEGITIYGGTAQVQALGRLLEVLAPEESHRAIPSCDDKDDNDKFTEEQNGSGGNENATETGNEPVTTSFLMSFPCIDLILPNDSKIQMPKSTFRYCMDGTMCTMEGTEGIIINDFNFLLLDNDATWLVDFTRSTFLLEAEQWEDAAEDFEEANLAYGEEAGQWEDAVGDFEEASTASTIVVARIFWLEREMKRLLQGVQQMLYSSSLCASHRDIFQEENPSSGSDPSTWSVTVAGMLAARMEGDSQTEYIEASLLSPYLFLTQEKSTDKWTLEQINMEGASIGPTSFGDIRVSIPPLSMATDRKEICLEGCVKAMVQTTAAIEDAQRFLQRALSSGAQELESAPSQDKMDFPFAICVQAVTIDISTPGKHIEMDEVKMRDSTVSCGLLRYAERDGAAARVSGLKATFLQDIEAKLQQIESLHIPGVLDLAKPIDDTTLSFMKGVLQIEMPYAQVVIAEKKDSLPTRQEHTASATPDNAVLPFPVRLQLPELRLQTHYDTGCSIAVYSIDLEVAQMDESIALYNDGDMKIRLESSDDEWLDSSVAGTLMILSPSNEGFLLSSMTCDNLHVGSSAFGHISVDMPSMEMQSGSQELCVDGVMEVSLESMDVATRIRSFLMPLLGNDSTSSSSHPLTLKVPNLTLSISEIGAQVTAAAVKVGGSEVSCGFLSMLQSNGTWASVSGISGTFGEVVIANLERIEALCLPGVGTLERPVGRTKLAFDGDVLQIFMPTTCVLMLANGDCEKRMDDSKDEATLPFPIYFNINELNVSNASDSKQIWCRRVELEAKPIQADSFNSSGITVQVGVGEVENEMLKLDAVRSSAVIFGGKIDTVHNFTFSTASAVVAAGSSSIDWSSMLGDGTDQQMNSVMLLPSACIDTFTAHLSYAGKTVATHVSVRIPAFQGGPSTTLNDMVGHLRSAVLRKVPAVISNTTVLGENVCDMTATVLGSAVGLVALDSVQAAVATGKTIRNASSDDAYKFGDFSRGLTHSIKQVATNPVGAARTVGKYTRENKSRLRIAYASGVGMVVGSVLLGPVGLVVGFLGGRAGQKAIEQKKKKERTISKN